MPGRSLPARSRWGTDSKKNPRQGPDPHGSRQNLHAWRRGQVDQHAKRCESGAGGQDDRPVARQRGSQAPEHGKHLEWRPAWRRGRGLDRRPLASLSCLGSRGIRGLRERLCDRLQTERRPALVRSRGSRDAAGRDGRGSVPVAAPGAAPGGRSTVGKLGERPQRRRISPGDRPKRRWQHRPRWA
jgi:hypothetical protein